MPMETTQAMPDYYCVFAGWVPGIYNSFEEAQEQICDFHDPSWAKFATLDNANKAWVLFFDEGDYDRGINRINNSYALKPVSQDHHRHNQRLALQALRERFQREDQLPLPRYLSSEDLASKKPASAHLLSFSMQKLLNNVCDKLDIPKPLYQAITKIFRDGRTCYRHHASLVPPTSQDALVESGRIAFDEETSIEDAVRMTLRALCATLDVVVYDYNYDIVQTLTDMYANLTNDYCNILRKGKINIIASDSTDEAQEKVFDLDAITYRRLGASTSTVTPEMDWSFSTLPTATASSLHA